MPLRYNVFRFFIILFIGFFSLNNSKAQTPSWSWAKSGEGINHDFVEDMAIDESGNCLITGRLQSDSIVFGSVTLTNQGPFVVKYSPTGIVIWAKSYYDYNGGAYGITSDENNNVYFTGYFSQPGIQFDSITLSSVGNSDMFITKLDSNGTVVWAKSAGTINSDGGVSVDTDRSGNVYVAGGYYNAPITFDSIILDNDFVADIFITKYDEMGNVMWANSLNGDESDGVSKISIDQNGNILITGHYVGNYLRLGSDTLFNLSSGYPDIYLAKFDSIGNYIWSKSIGGYSWEMSKDLALSTDGQIYMIGGYSSSYFIIDSINTVNPIPGISDIFILKYDSNGNLIWSRTLGGGYFDLGYGITTDSTGNLYITGMYKSLQVDFGNTILSNSNLLNSKTFIAKYDSSGNENWAISLGDTNDNWSKRILLDEALNLYITGTFNSSNLAIGTFNLPGNLNHSHVVYTAKLTDLSNALSPIVESNLINIYPNPNSGLFLISNKTTEHLIITFYNIHGNILIQRETSQFLTDFNLTAFPAGVYLFEVRLDNILLKRGKVIIY